MLSNTLRRRLVNLKTNGVEAENVVDAVQCSEECTDLHIEKTKQLFYLCSPVLSMCSTQVSQLLWTGLSGLPAPQGQGLDISGQQRENTVLAREDSWFERRVKEQPLSYRAGGITHIKSFLWASDQLNNNYSNLHLLMQLRSSGARKKPLRTIYNSMVTSAICDGKRRLHRQENGICSKHSTRLH